MILQFIYVIYIKQLSTNTIQYNTAASLKPDHFKNGSQFGCFNLVKNKGTIFRNRKNIWDSMEVDK